MQEQALDSQSSPTRLEEAYASHLAQKVRRKESRVRLSHTDEGDLGDRELDLEGARRQRLCSRENRSLVDGQVQLLLQLLVSIH